MPIFHFSIVIRDARADNEALEDRLFAAGCDDALLCFYNKIPYLEFDREGENAKAAIQSALQDIRNAGFQDLVVQESGYATLSEMAQRAGLTRAALSNYATGKRDSAENFPAPVYGVGSGSALYAWNEVATWLHQRGQLSQSLYEVSEAANNL